MNRAPQSIRAPVLSVEHVWKAFGATVALHDVSLEVATGEVHALLGHNGSGKSTLIKILSGYHAPDQGRVALKGQEVTYPTTALALVRRGISFMHQDIGVVPSLSIMENIRVTRFTTGLLGHIRWRDERRHVLDLLRSFRLDFDPDQPVSTLSAAERAVVGILRAVQDVEETSDGLIVLDEPTAALPAEETSLLFDTIHSVADRGLGVLFVTHHMNEPLAVANRVSVLRDGACVATANVRDLAEADLVELVTGASAALPWSSPAADPPPHPEVVLEARGLAGDEVHDACVTLRRGEVLGLTGPMGAGHQEIPFLLYGATPLRTGAIVLRGRPFVPDPPSAQAARIAMVSGDRARAGGVLTASVQENLSLPLLHRLRGPAGWIRRRREEEFVEQLLDQFNIIAQPSLPFSSLSGGNQQKALIARWLASNPEILLLQEPTSGVDIASVRDIIHMVRRFAQSGGSVIWSSEQYEDLARVSDRVIVFRDGANVTELSGINLNTNELLMCCHASEAPLSPPA